jgi:hypothetical protein
MAVELLTETVQRLGARLGSTFVDGGVHPRFGTRNFTMPLQNGQYIEVVCPLDHPATEQTPWGKAVSKKAQEGGGWLTWVFATEDISKVEEKFGRPAIEKITIADTDHLADSWFKPEILDGFNSADIEFIDPSTNDGEYGIVGVHLTTPSGVMRLD